MPIVLKNFIDLCEDSKMDRKRKKILIVFLSVFLLSGCVSKEGVVKNQKRTNEVLGTIRYKQNINVSWGQGAAIYEENLYYHDIIEGVAGIYKQNLKDEKKELLIEVESIRKIQITEDGIYYIGRTRDNDVEIIDTAAKWNTYQLFFHEGYEKDEKAAEVVTEDMGIQDDVFAWDFYVTENYIFFEIIICTIPIGVPDFYSYIFPKEGIGLSVEDWMSVKTNMEREKAISKCGDLLFLSSTIMKAELSERLAHFIQSIYDENIKSVIYSASDRYGRIATDDALFIGKYNGLYFCTEEDRAYLLTEKVIHKEAEFESVDKFNFGFMNEDQAFLIGETKGRETIYIVDLKHFETKELQKLDRKEKAVAIISSGIVCVTNKEVRLRDIDTGKVLYTQQWDNKIDLLKDTVEMAGNYIFIYDYSNGIVIKEKQKLAYK